MHAPTPPPGTSERASGDGRLLLEFCGETVPIEHTPYTIGRVADFVLDDANRFLHRHFLTIDRQNEWWTLTNSGRLLSATVSDTEGMLEAFLAPGAGLPLVLGSTIVRFTSGPTTYEFALRLDRPSFRSAVAPARCEEVGDTTIGRVTMTPDQFRLVLALAEPVLNGGGTAAMPASSEAAQRLGWTLTKFNRKLDNVCHKLARHGVRGLHGAPGRLASNRRARLVEYALATRLATRDDLRLLDGLSRGVDAR